LVVRTGSKPDAQHQHHQHSKIMLGRRQYSIEMQIILQTEAQYLTTE